jgi:hypothetical protein
VSGQLFYRFSDLEQEFSAIDCAVPERPVCRGERYFRVVPKT